MKIISSPHNPLIKQIATLHTAKGRAAHNLFIAEGARTCATLIENKITIEQLYCTDEQLPIARTLVDEQNITCIPNSILKKISTAKTPSGIVGVFNIPAQPDPKTIVPGLVLANTTDPGNMGTLIRTAAALDKKSIVIIDGTDPWSPKVVQATAGTVGAVSLFRYTWDEFTKQHPDTPRCALVVKNGKAPETLNLKDMFLIVGNEGHGIPDKWLVDCHEQATLKMPGKTESLNAAVAGSIALYLSIL